MEEAEFDKFAEEYSRLHRRSTRASGEEPEFFLDYKVRDAARLFARAPTAERPRILDFGAGTGISVPFFHQHFREPSVTCLDVSGKSLELGRERHGDAADFVRFDGRTIPSPDERFDVAFAACVFHHVPHDEHPHLLAELVRTLRPGGLLVVFEHNPLNPLTRRAVNTCPYDEDAVLIGAGALRRRVERLAVEGVERRYRLFFPGPLRRLRPLERYLTWLPLGAQYFVAATKPQARS